IEPGGYDHGWCVAEAEGDNHVGDLAAVDVIRDQPSDAGPRGMGLRPRRESGGRAERRGSAEPLPPGQASVRDIELHDSAISRCLRVSLAWTRSRSLLSTQPNQRIPSLNAAHWRHPLHFQAVL